MSCKLIRPFASCNNSEVKVTVIRIHKMLSTQKTRVASKYLISQTTC